MKTNTGILSRIAVVTVMFLAASLTICRAELVSVNTITNNANMIGVFFAPPVTLPSATNPANYTVMTKTGAVSVVSVSLQTNSQFAVLNLAANVGEFFSVTTTNIVDAATNTINATEIGTISDYGSTDIGTVGDPSPAGQVYTPHVDTFQVTTGGSDVGGTNDFFHFVYQEIVGDFDIAVSVTRLDMADDLSKAGLMARETLSADSLTLQTYFTPTGGSNEVEVAVRSTTGGATTDSGFQIGPRASANPLRWLRLTRSNNTFTAYHGTNGFNWTVSGITTQAFNSTLNIGMMVASHTTNGVATTAEFRNFRRSGARPGDGVFPVLSATLSGTNLNLSWLRTPRDFAVKVSTNLTDWALLLAPILESVTNSNQRSMQVPLNLSSNQLFMQLRTVDRVVPGNLNLSASAGTIYTLGLGTGLNTGSGSTLCAASVSGVVVQTDAYINVPTGKSAEFTTKFSGTVVDTVMQLRKLPVLPIQTKCDDNSVLPIKARIFTTSFTSGGAGNFTFVVGAKGSPVTPIVVTIIVSL